MNTEICPHCNGIVSKASKYEHFSFCKSTVNLKENEDYIRCAECGYKSTKLEHHIKIHGLDTHKYKRKYPQVAMVAANTISKRAKSNIGKCVKPLELSSQSVVCHKCNQLYDKRKPQEHFVSCIKERPERWVVGVDYVVCPECSLPYLCLNSHMTEKHGWKSKDLQSVINSGVKLTCDMLNAKWSASGKQAWEKIHAENI